MITLFARKNRASGAKRWRRLRLGAVVSGGHTRLMHSRNVDFVSFKGRFHIMPSANCGCRSALLARVPEEFESAALGILAR